MEYKRRYNRPPPAGFDRWWQFCQENGVGLPDEYDTIMDQLGPFSALHPDIFQQRHAELPGMAVAKNSFVYEIKDGKDVWHIEVPKYGRLASWARFLEPIVQHLPDMNFTINLSDSASQMISGEAKVRLVEAAKSNTCASQCFPQFCVLTYTASSSHTRAKRRTSRSSRTWLLWLVSWLSAELQYTPVDARSLH